MKNGLILLFLLNMTFSGFAQNLKIYTGVKNCGNYEFTKDLERYYNGTLDIVETEGSLDNLDKLKPGEIAITQFDVLQEQLLKSIMGLAQSTDSFRILLPIGKTEIHLLTMKDNINQIRDLAGKKVSVGLPKQGTSVTAANIKKLINIQWLDVEMGLTESIAALFGGEIDAMFYVGAAPVSQFSNFSMLSPTAQKKIKLIPILDNRLSESYGTTIRINAGEYTWLKADINTYAVETLLVVDKTGQTPVQLSSYSDLVTSIKDNLLSLQKIAIVPNGIK